MNILGIKDEGMYYFLSLLLIILSLPQMLHNRYQQPLTFIEVNIYQIPNARHWDAGYFITW